MPREYKMFTVRCVQESCSKNLLRRSRNGFFASRSEKKWTQHFWIFFLVLSVRSGSGRKDGRKRKNLVRTQHSLNSIHGWRLRFGVCMWISRATDCCSLSLVCEQCVLLLLKLQDDEWTLIWSKTRATENLATDHDLQTDPGQWWWWWWKFITENEKVIRLLRDYALYLKKSLSVQQNILFNTHFMCNQTSNEHKADQLKDTEARLEAKLGQIRWYKGRRKEGKDVEPSYFATQLNDWFQNNWNFRISISTSW